MPGSAPIGAGYTNSGPSRNGLGLDAGGSQSASGLGGQRSDAGSGTPAMRRGHMTSTRLRCDMRRCHRWPRQRNPDQLWLGSRARSISAGGCRRRWKAGPMPNLQMPTSPFFSADQSIAFRWAREFASLALPSSSACLLVRSSPHRCALFESELRRFVRWPAVAGVQKRRRPSAVGVYAALMGCLTATLPSATVTAIAPLSWPHCYALFPDAEDCPNDLHQPEAPLAYDVIGSKRQRPE